MARIAGAVRRSRLWCAATVPFQVIGMQFHQDGRDVIPCMSRAPLWHGAPVNTVNQPHLQCGSRPVSEPLSRRSSRRALAIIKFVSWVIALIFRLDWPAGTGCFGKDAGGYSGNGLRQAGRCWSVLTWWRIPVGIAKSARASDASISSAVLAFPRAVRRDAKHIAIRAQQDDIRTARTKPRRLWSDARDRSPGMGSSRPCAASSAHRLRESVVATRAQCQLEE